MTPEQQEYFDSEIKDIRRGGSGNDVLVGGAGNDWLVGNGGDDIPPGGLGNDNLSGGTGNVTITEMHAGVAADVDGDGIPDFITGKRHFSHLESLIDADPWGEPVLYWFRTVRNPKAPGGAEFVPELIHNRSGVGSQFSAGDMNKDGAVDIVTSTNRGTFIFWGTPRKKK